MDRPSQLILDDDPDFQRRFWRVQRFVWGLFALVILLALAGGAGAGGVLATRHVKAGEGVEVRFPAIARWRTPAHLAVGFDAERSTEIEFDHAFLELYAIDRAVPDPQSAELTRRGIRMSFSADGGGVAYFDLVPRHPALGRRVSIRVGDEDFRYQAFVLP